MSNYDRNALFGLIAFGLSVTSIVLVVLITALDKPLPSPSSVDQWIIAGTSVISTAASIFGLAWVIRTWHKTRRAANAAFRATELAREANEHAKEVFLEGKKQALQSGRPYLLIEHDSCNANEWRRGDNFLEWKFRVANYGSNPGVIRTLSANVILSDIAPNPDGSVDRIETKGGEKKARLRSGYKMEKETVSYGFIIRGGTSSGEFLRRGPSNPLGKDRIPAIEDSRKILYDLTAGDIFSHYLTVELHYEDLHFNKYLTRACLRVHPLTQKVSEVGGEAMNSRT